MSKSWAGDQPVGSPVQMVVRRAVSGLTLLAVIGIVALLFAQGLRPVPQHTDLNTRLQKIVSDLVANDPSIKNCVLALESGDGSLTWSGAAGNAHDQAAMTVDTPIYIASVTKLYTATVVMILHERGQLSLDDPMAKYLPEELIRRINVFGGKDYSSQITLRHLLAHRSGIADYYTEKSRDGKTMFELFLEDPGRRWAVDDTIARARDQLQANLPPGTATSYSDTNFQLLGRVIEVATGKPLHLVYEELLFRPLGLKRTWLVGHPRSDPAIQPADVFLGLRNITAVRANGAYWADGGIVSTAREMNVFLMALKQERLVRRDTLAQMHDWHSWRFPLQYGYGTMSIALPGPLSLLMGLPPLWGHSGTTGAFLYYSENLDLYLAGSIDQTHSEVKPFMLMRKAIGAVTEG